MSKDLINRFLSAIIFFVLIASTLFTVPARADSGSPPPAPTGGSSSTSSTTTTVSQVPTTVTNVAGGDGGGHKVKLDNQKAAYSAEAGDPVWCPSSMGAPTPGAGACTINYGDMAGLITYLTTHQKTVDGTIWINGGGPDTSGPNTMDGGVAFATMANHKLTLKGSWTGIAGTINTLSPSLFSKALMIVGWHKDITLSDLQVNNVITGTGRGLYITTDGNITLTRVQANNDNGYGAYLNNSSGTGIIKLTNSQFIGDALPTDPYALDILSHNAVILTNVTSNGGWGTYIDNSGASNKPVTITTGNFNGNFYNGLLVVSKGAITLTNVSANSNNNIISAYGAKLDNSSSTTAAPVTLIGSNNFNANHDDGLDILSKGSVKLNNITATSNANGYGVHINNNYVGATGGVSFTGSNTFASNDLDGLNVNSRGAISLNSIVSTSNSNGYGVYLVNTSAVIPQPITLTGTNVVVSNKYDGLNVSSHGAITISSITAVSNSNGYGVYLNNHFVGATAGVTLAGSTNTFVSNYFDGLDIISNGAIKLNHVISISNSNGYGVFLNNSFLGFSGGVTLTGTNTLVSNKYDGLNVTSNGAILLNSVTASSNSSGYGAYLNNTGVTSPKPVTITGTNFFTFNYYDGLNISSKGAIKINSTTAVGNSHGNGSVIDNSTALTPQPVTLTGLNTFNENYYDGLDVFSKGAIKAGDLTVDLNGTSSDPSLRGAVLQNNYPGAVGGITLTGTNLITRNYGTGLEVLSKGAITLNSIIADLNSNGSGLVVNNSTATAAQPVNLTGTSEFKINLGNGLLINSKGTVSLKNITGDDNLGAGAVVINIFGGTGAPKTVTLAGYGIFSHNLDDGLFVQTYGAVTTNNLTALDNGNGLGENGVQIVNSGVVTPASVTLNGVNVFNDNYDYGLYILSNGAIKINSITANSNLHHNGAYLDNGTAGSIGGVTLTGINVFNGNQTDNLLIGSRGAISLSNITANDSSIGYGLNLNNTYGGTGAPKPVTISGTNVLNHNWFTGLSVQTIGAITLHSLTANENGVSGVGYGGYLVNSVVPANVTLTGLNNFNNNNEDGLDVYTKGVVSMTRVTADNNGNDGLYVNTNGKITLTCGSFINNGSTGVYMTSPTTMTLIGVIASGNGTNITTTGGGTAHFVRTCPLP